MRCNIIILLIVFLKLNPFLSLIISAIFVGIFQGMPPITIVKSIEAGLGGTLGHLAIIIGLGAIFGKIKIGVTDLIDNTFYPCEG
ncbi:GntT/GntP/DsdX family permease [Bacillus massiliigorillae]|uniref:GntT/GntP/DsdX family permease n=1 Tax=Bacillus massiliigorillae TaxID=1243664 RepID=UPI0005A8AC1C|nr:hypothetical protein [Bacillus massiliigorillae]